MICAECGRDVRVVSDAAASFWRWECADCGSTGPFLPAGENPAYGPGNPDWAHDREREDREP